MDELLSINQVAQESGYSSQEMVDSLRAGYIAPHCVSGQVLFVHPGQMPIYKIDEVYINRTEFKNYLSNRMLQPPSERVVSRKRLLVEVGKLGSRPAFERRRMARMALAVYEGAAHDEPENRYLAGVRDVLRELCLREGVWLHANRLS